MNLDIVKFLRTAFPFIAVLLLWKLSVSFWNPGGILAIIPIFYYSFIKKTPWFVPFGALFCFLIDYNFDSLLFWTSMFCLLYAVNGFQSFIDITTQKRNGLFVFMVFFGICSLVLALFGFTFTGLLRGIWIFLWISVLYIPFTAIAKRISDD